VTTMYYSNDHISHRNWFEESSKVTEQVNSEVVTRKATPEELERFEKFKPENKMNTKWAVRF
jgi:hypothetical protein